MRTKLVLGAAVLAAGLASSMAQNVYSLNVVGYVNLTVPPGYSLNANQLISASGTNGINEVLPAPPDNALVLTFVNHDYNTDIGVGGVWLDYNTFGPSTTTLDPGKGWFYDNPLSTTSTLTLVGTVPQGTSTVTLPPGYAMVGTVTPQALSLDTTNGFPMPDNTLYLTYSTTIHDYVTSIIVSGQWLDYNTFANVTIAPPVGLGYFINNPQSTSATWSYNFTVQ